jgi:hypothetical protein
MHRTIGKIRPSRARKPEKTVWYANQSLRTRRSSRVLNWMHHSLAAARAWLVVPAFALASILTA